MSYPIERVRGDFPLLAREVNGQPLAYLDSAASAQKPQAVIDRELEFYRHGYAAVHRGIHTLSAEATQQMEAVREQAARFINAASAEEMVFVKGTTEGINLVANSFGRHLLQPGDAILITEMEHHANIVPWQMLAQERGLQLRVWPLQPDGTLDLARLPELVDASCKLLALTEVSNVLGTVNPVRDIIAGARALAPNLTVLVDGAQAVMHQCVDVQALDCDFYVFSGHKLYGPFRHRHAVWPPGAAAADAAVGRGRLDDPPGQPDGGHHLRRSAVALRGRFAEQRRHHGAGGGVRLRRSPGPECDPRLRTVADALRAEGAQPGADAESLWPGPSRRGDRLQSG